MITFESVSKRFPDGTTAVDDLDLEVREGEVTVLVGPSGCGKTTTLRMVNRMIEASGGRIVVDGQDVKQVDPPQLRRRIGYVIQQVGLFPHRTIGENIATVPDLVHWEKRRTKARIDELLDLIGLPAEVVDRYPHQLSGGQRQRVGVARALAVDPPIMLMDEPFGAVDPIVRSRLQDEFLRLQAELAKTILFVTHDIDEAIKMGDHIAIMQRGGHLAQYAPPAELLMNPANSFVEDFVGADRALKRLSLQRVRDVNLWKAPLVREGEPVAAARAKVADSEVPYPLLIDERGRPLGWLSERGLTGELVTPELSSRAETVIELDDILRDALSDLLAEEAQYGPVVDERGEVCGVLSIEILALSLKTPSEQVPHGADAAS